MNSSHEKMPKILARAHFDGKQIVLDEPLDLAPGTPLMVSVLPEEMENERADWGRLASASLARAYSDREPEYGPKDMKPNRSLAVFIGVAYLMFTAGVFSDATNWSYAVALLVTIGGAAIVMASIAALGMRAYVNKDRRIRFKFSTVFLASIPFSVYLAGMRVFVQSAPIQQFGLAEVLFVLVIGVVWMTISTAILLGLAEAIVAIAVGILRWRHRIFSGQRRIV